MQDYAGGGDRSCKLPQMRQGVKGGAREFFLSTSDQLVKQCGTGQQKQMERRAGTLANLTLFKLLDSRWNVMAHGNARDGNWRGNWRMELVASTHHTALEHGVSRITTADAHTSASSSRLNWRPLGLFKRTGPFRRKTKSHFNWPLPRLKMSRAIVLLRLHALVMWTGRALPYLNLPYPYTYYTGGKLLIY